MSNTEWNYLPAVLSEEVIAGCASAKQRGNQETKTWSPPAKRVEKENPRILTVG